MSGLPRFRSWIVPAVLFITCIITPENAAFSAETTSAPPQKAQTQEEYLRPRAPSPSLRSEKDPTAAFRCDRMIRYQGRTLPCDSALRRDGESLRSILEAHPDALAELDLYQKGRRNVRHTAITGTAGLVFALLGETIANLLIDESRPTARKDVGSVLRYGGAGITLGSVAFGISYLKANEDHLNRAIMKYNAAEPKRPIQILFKAEF